jgi:hypothetical protein
MNLTKAIKAWSMRLKLKRRKNEFKRGYDYGAGVLLRGEESPMSLESYLWSHPESQFDRGMIAAVDKLVAEGVVKDNRI